MSSRKKSFLFHEPASCTVHQNAVYRVCSCKQNALKRIYMLGLHTQCLHWSYTHTRARAFNGAGRVDESGQTGADTRLVYL